MNVREYSPKILNFSVGALRVPIFIADRVTCGAVIIYYTKGRCGARVF